MKRIKTFDQISKTNEAKLDIEIPEFVYQKFDAIKQGAREKTGFIADIWRDRWKTKPYVGPVEGYGRFLAGLTRDRRIFNWRPAVFISFDFGQGQREISRPVLRKLIMHMQSANEQFRRILSKNGQSYRIQALDEDESRHGEALTFVVFVIDKNDNPDYSEDSGACNTDEIFKDFWEEFPLTKI